ncbi:hypothetical protein GGR51DRAFT_541316 [Nemania sp. FL0031]|nr:hypothetical protein GGR51DRAFT_541316 [Nemania sp. FL0031]
MIHTFICGIGILLLRTNWAYKTQHTTTRMGLRKGNFIRRSVSKDLFFIGPFQLPSFSVYMEDFALRSWMGCTICVGTARISVAVAQALNRHDSAMF